MDTFEPSPVIFIISTAAVAIVVLLLNLKVKVPKKIFLLLAVLLVVFTGWYAFEDSLPIPRLDSEDSGVRSVIRALPGSPPVVSSDVVVKLPQGSSDTASSLRFLIDPPQGMTAPRLELFSFSLIKANGEEIVCSALGKVGADGNFKISAHFIFRKEVPMSEFSALHIKYSGEPYSCKNSVLIEVSRKNL